MRLATGCALHLERVVIGFFLCILRTEVVDSARIISLLYSMVGDLGELENLPDEFC